MAGRDDSLELENKMKTMERFFQYVDKSGPCWIWKGALSSGGYGSFGLGGRKGQMYGAHRLSYEFHNGKIPEGLFVCHSCDVRNCVNPEHLWTGTAKDNLHDAINKGRYHGNQRKGEAHGGCKMTLDKSLEIQRLFATGEYSQLKLAELFSVSKSTIHNICRGHSWR